jgi:hypothetical protein
MRELSKKALDKALRESTFNPKSPGPMKLFTEMPAEYLLRRSIELLHEAEYLDPSENIKKAISLLALVRVKHELEGIPQKRGTPEFKINRDTRK